MRINDSRDITPHWQSPDPLFDTLNEACTKRPLECANRYAYALSNPVNFTDPTGETARDAIAGFAIGFWNGVGMMANSFNARDCNDNPMSRVEFKPQAGVWSTNAADDAHFRGGVEAGKIVGTWGTIFATRPRTTKDAVPSTGVSVLGKYPTYIELAENLGGKRFSVPSNFWNKMTANEQWAANQKFLDRMIARGDEIILANPVKNVSEANGWYGRELRYLSEQGFRLNADGTRMLR